MEYIFLDVPPYPFFSYSGDALYRPGDVYRRKPGIYSFDLLFVEYGGLYIKEDNNFYHVKKNDALILSPGRIHKCNKACDEKTYYHWLRFGAAESFRHSSTLDNKSKYIEKTNHNKIKLGTLVLPVFQSLPDTVAANVLQILNDLESLTTNKYLNSSLISKENGRYTSLQQQEQFLALLSFLTIVDKDTDSYGIASTLMRYLHTNYSSKLNLHSMAEVVNCHPTHVIRCFNKKYHTTPVKALMDIRLQQSKRLLQSTDLSCEEISYKVGFSSASYFSKLFKEHNGVTPQNYRKRSPIF